MQLDVACKITKLYTIKPTARVPYTKSISSKKLLCFGNRTRDLSFTRFREVPGSSPVFFHVRKIANFSYCEVVEESNFRKSNFQIQRCNRREKRCRSATGIYRWVWQSSSRQKDKMNKTEIYPNLTHALYPSAFQFTRVC